MLPLFRLPPERQREWLARQLARPTPASAVGLSDGFRLPGREGATRDAAVLVPIVNRPEGLTVLFTQRSASLPDHPGQISFPGGRVDPGDASHAAAALRETHEEVGLPPLRVALLGELASYQTVTGYIVKPVVGWVEPPFDVTPDPVEVADVFEVPLAFLLDPANQQRHFRMLGSLRRDYYAIPLRRSLHLGRHGGDADHPRSDAPRALAGRFRRRPSGPWMQRRHCVAFGLEHASRGRLGVARRTGTGKCNATPSGARPRLSRVSRMR